MHGQSVWRRGASCRIAARPITARAATRGPCASVLLGLSRRSGGATGGISVRPHARLVACTGKFAVANPYGRAGRAQGGRSAKAPPIRATSAQGRRASGAHQSLADRRGERVLREAAREAVTSGNLSGATELTAHRLCRRRRAAPGNRWRRHRPRAPCALIMLPATSQAPESLPSQPSKSMSNPMLCCACPPHPMERGVRSERS